MSAGIPLSDVYESDTGVFVGAFMQDYASLMDKDPTINTAHRATGLGFAMLANRLSYWFGLRGPSMPVDTACSASAASFHLACESLKTGTSTMALVSGANIILEPGAFSTLSQMKYVQLACWNVMLTLTHRFLSPDGRSFFFDDRANGYARGEGIVTLLLKPLTEALRCNDPIHAIVRNTGMNQDGKTPGITLPNQRAQQELMSRTYQQARLDPEDTDLLEAHVTVTVAGDKAEAEALVAGLETARRSTTRPLRVVSVKTKVGHTEAASGVAGILHAIVALKNRKFFANSNFEYPSKEIKFREWRVKVRIRPSAGGMHSLYAVRFPRATKIGYANTLEGSL